jgi:hypothetical protein
MTYETGCSTSKVSWEASLIGKLEDLSDFSVQDVFHIIIYLYYYNPESTTIPLFKQRCPHIG